MLRLVPPTRTFPANLTPGLTARRIDPDTDRAGVVELVRAYDAAYARGMAAPAEEVVADLVASGDDLARNAWLVLDADRVVGLGWFTVEDADPSMPVYWFDVYVTPELPADAGLERTLATVMLERAREELAESGAAQAYADSGCMRDDDRTRRALEAAGMAHIRSLWRMERPLDGSVTAGDPPAGVGVRSALDDETDRALLHELYTRTFAHHWGTVEPDADRWWSTLRQGVGIDPAQWWIAEVDGRPVGFLMGDASRSADGGGYVRLLGVLEEARGRGIARHLLRLAFAEQARRGWTWSQLTVDTGNITGAPQLYASAGMEPVEVIDLYRRTLSRSDPQP